MRNKFFTFAIGGLFILCFLVQFVLIRNKSSNPFFRGHMDVFSEVKKLMRQAPVLQERLFLIDRKILRRYEDDIAEEDDTKSCVFCNIRRGQPVTFALLCPTNTSLEVCVSFKTVLDKLRIYRNFIFRSMFYCLFLKPGK